MLFVGYGMPPGVALDPSQSSYPNGISSITDCTSIIDLNKRVVGIPLSPFRVPGIKPPSSPDHHPFAMTIERYLQSPGYPPYIRVTLHYS